MANLLVGDIHGCYVELEMLLQKANFKPTQDTLWLTGDLVARGSQSLEVLRYIRNLPQSAVKMVLGNHDLHLLAIHAGISQAKKNDHLEKVLAAPDIDELMLWLRQQPLLQFEPQLKLLMSHAGISPQWDLTTAKLAAEKAETALRSSNYCQFLQNMYGNSPNTWSTTLSLQEQLRYTINTLTRMRYCFSDGSLDFSCKSPPSLAPTHLAPWFTLLSEQQSQGYCIAFGHWASLQGKGTPSHIYALDTGCCWGNKLTLLCWETKKVFTQKFISKK